MLRKLWYFKIEKTGITFFISHIRYKCLQSCIELPLATDNHQYNILPRKCVKFFRYYIFVLKDRKIDISKQSIELFYTFVLKDLKIYISTENATSVICNRYLFCIHRTWWNSTILGKQEIYHPHPHLKFTSKHEQALW